MVESDHTYPLMVYRLAYRGSAFQDPAVAHYTAVSFSIQPTFQTSVFEKAIEQKHTQSFNQNLWPPQQGRHGNFLAQ